MNVSMIRRPLAALCAALAACLAAAAAPAAAQDSDTLGTWQDRVLIEQTLQRYVAGFDQNDPELFASAFAPEGVFNYNADTYAGRQAIHDFIADRNAARAAREAAGTSDPSARLFHVMTNSVILFDGPDRARHTAYGITVGRTTGETHLSSSGSYSDELAKIDGEWLIVRRDLEQLPLFVPPPVDQPVQ